MSMYLLISAQPIASNLRQIFGKSERNCFFFVKWMNADLCFRMLYQWVRPNKLTIKQLKSGNSHVTRLKCLLWAQSRYKLRNNQVVTVYQICKAILAHLPRTAVSRSVPTFKFYFRLFSQFPREFYWFFASFPSFALVLPRFKDNLIYRKFILQKGEYIFWT